MQTHMKTLKHLLILSIFYSSIGCEVETKEDSQPTFRQLKYKKHTNDLKKKGLYFNVEQATIENYDFRNVVYTGTYLQLALMNLEPGEDIGWETHPRSDQFIRVEAGNGLCLVNDEAYDLQPNDAVLIPAGARHNILNNSDSLQLKIYTLYARPVHKDKITRSTKEEAKEKKEHYDGETSE
jgi:mannose-6-phosphate isomerase-like protein (cupin superfamily)